MHKRVTPNDVLKRWLQYSGYEVEHVCNLTDVDDKISTTSYHYPKRNQK